MSEAKHSPLPWKLDGDFVNDAAGDRVCQFFNKFEEDFENGRGNATLIVSAVNAHPAVEALARALEAIAQRAKHEYPVTIGNQGAWAWVERESRAALAAYEEAK